MGEHSARYAEVARQLNDIGLTVYAHDHRGHGATINGTAIESKGNKQGAFGDNGWEAVILDVKQVVEHIREQHPQQPLFLLGHSMGSYMLQGYLHRYDPKVNGVILSSSNYIKKPLLTVARLIANLEVFRQGEDDFSPIIHQLTFAGYNRIFKPNTTEFDWLSRDPEPVLKYVNDPLCGFRCTNQLWKQLFDGLNEICSVQTLRRIHAELPVFIIGGAADPVSAPNALKHLYQAWVDSGHTNTTLKLYPEARHELFNETNREEVMGDLIHWLDSHI